MAKRVKTTQNKLKQAKTTQNEPKRLETSQNKPEGDLKRAKTS